NVSSSNPSPQDSDIPDSSGGNFQSFGRGSYSRGRNNRGGRFRGRGGRNGYRNSVQCQICYKPGHDASYCYYRHSQDSYGVYPPYGAPVSFGNFSFSQPNVWTQPGFRAPSSSAVNQARSMAPVMASQYSGARPQALIAGTDYSPFYNQAWFTLAMAKGTSKVLLSGSLGSDGLYKFNCTPPPSFLSSPQQPSFSSINPDPGSPVSPSQSASTSPHSVHPETSSADSSAVSPQVDIESSSVGISNSIISSPFTEHSSPATSVHPLNTHPMSTKCANFSQTLLRIIGKLLSAFSD
ncbi:unnamed protein product, partial [Vicia faba]